MPVLPRCYERQEATSCRGSVATKENFAVHKERLKLSRIYRREMADFAGDSIDLCILLSVKHFAVASRHPCTA